MSEPVVSRLYLKYRGGSPEIIEKMRAFCQTRPVNIVDDPSAPPFFHHEEITIWFDSKDQCTLCTSVRGWLEAKDFQKAFDLITSVCQGFPSGQWNLDIQCENSGKPIYETAGMPDPHDRFLYFTINPILERHLSPEMIAVLANTAMTMHHLAYLI